MESRSIRKSSENSLFQRKNQSDTDIDLKPKGKFSHDFSSGLAFHKPRVTRMYKDSLFTQADDIQVKLDQIGRSSLKPPETNLNSRSHSKPCTPSKSSKSNPLSKSQIPEVDPLIRISSLIHSLNPKDQHPQNELIRKLDYSDPLLSTRVLNNPVFSQSHLDDFESKSRALELERNQYLQEIKRIRNEYDTYKLVTSEKLKCLENEYRVKSALVERLEKENSLITKSKEEYFSIIQKQKTEINILVQQRPMEVKEKLMLQSNSVNDNFRLVICNEKIKSQEEAIEKIKQEHEKKLINLRKEHETKIEGKEMQILQFKKDIQELYKDKSILNVRIDENNVEIKKLNEELSASNVEHINLMQNSIAIIEEKLKLDKKVNYVSCKYKKMKEFCVELQEKIKRCEVEHKTLVSNYEEIKKTNVNYMGKIKNLQSLVDDKNTERLGHQAKIDQKEIEEWSKKLKDTQEALAEANAKILRSKRKKHAIQTEFEKFKKESEKIQKSYENDRKLVDFKYVSAQKDMRVLENIVLRELKNLVEANTAFEDSCMKSFDVFIEKISLLQKNVDGFAESNKRHKITLNEYKYIIQGHKQLIDVKEKLIQSFQNQSKDKNSDWISIPDLEKCKIEFVIAENHDSLLVQMQSLNNKLEKISGRQFGFCKISRKVSTYNEFFIKFFKMLQNSEMQMKISRISSIFPQLSSLFVSNFLGFLADITENLQNLYDFIDSSQLVSEISPLNINIQYSLINPPHEKSRENKYLEVFEVIELEKHIERLDFEHTAQNNSLFEANQELLLQENALIQEIFNLNFENSVLKKELITAHKSIFSHFKESENTTDLAERLQELKKHNQEIIKEHTLKEFKFTKTCEKYELALQEANSALKKLERLLNDRQSHEIAPGPVSQPRSSPETLKAKESLICELEAINEQYKILSELYDETNSALKSLQSENRELLEELQAVKEEKDNIYSELIEMQFNNKSLKD